MNLSRARESTNAIKRIYVAMQHLLNRGHYKPMGESGNALRTALLELRPEIYGSIAEEKTELNGLIYVLERLPEGIEACVHINLTSDEGYAETHLKAIVPPKRRRNCYRIDPEQMNIEITRGRSDVYDILTHLTFLYWEADKLQQRAWQADTQTFSHDWVKFSALMTLEERTEADRERALIHLASMMGRTYTEASALNSNFATAQDPDRMLSLFYWLIKRSTDEHTQGIKRSISFSPLLRERIGHHIYGEKWANNIKNTLSEHQLFHRPIHLISANMHSVMNALYAGHALAEETQGLAPLARYELLSAAENDHLRSQVKDYAQAHGMISIDDTSGTNIDVQVFDMAQCVSGACAFNSDRDPAQQPVLVVMDYAFGEQAFETVDEFLKPLNTPEGRAYLNIVSVSIMGKAGILSGDKGDLMIPNAHIFEGTADNYPFENALSTQDFDGHGLKVFGGPMLSVLGTSLQNKDILAYFQASSWGVIGLEMEGVHYQKAIQAAAKIRKNIREDVVVRYAYYASDNPLETGSTLASGGLGTTGVKPTYLITEKILSQIFND
ncbi:MAG: hypothetical protein NWS70_01030 [Flavobacteriaceae bacterium]|nr:hypothetical protein [Flavobacteriaceae bacterium]